MRASSTLAAVALVALAAGGCGSAHPTASAATTTPPAVAKDAAGWTQALRAAGLPVTQVTVYTAATDPNHLLGRPGGYSSKTAFVDSRLGAVPGDPGSVAAGGSVEVFANAAAAAARARYITAAEKAAPITGTEYDYLHGGALLRLSQKLTPDQAAAYDHAFGGIPTT